MHMAFFITKICICTCAKGLEGPWNSGRESSKSKGPYGETEGKKGQEAKGRSEIRAWFGWFGRREIEAPRLAPSHSCMQLCTGPVMPHGCRHEDQKGEKVKCLKQWHSWCTHGMHVASWSHSCKTCGQLVYMLRKLACFWSRPAALKMDGVEKNMQ